MPEVLAQPIVPSFDSVESLKVGLAAKANFEAVDLYPRDGSELLGEVQSYIARLAMTPSETVLAYSSGMSAVTDAIDVGLHTASTLEPKILCAQETYTQTKRYVENFLRGKRAQVTYFDSGNPHETAQRIAENQPDLILAETIGNFVNVPVLDVAALLQATRQQDKPPVVVLDHTLPLSTGLAIDEYTTEQDKLIVVESGTKSYSLNAELLGIGYTKNPNLLDLMKRYRRTRGSLPGLRSLELITECIPPNKEAFDERNQRVFKNTGNIALRLAENLAASFIISHPGVTDHDNHKFYTGQYPKQGTPLFYIQSGKFNQYEVATHLWAHPEVREQAQLGQSFGFNHTRIVADENVGAVRISGGADTDGTALGYACAEALCGI